MCSIGRGGTLFSIWFLDNALKCEQFGIEKWVTSPIVDHRSSLALVTGLNSVNHGMSLSLPVSTVAVFTLSIEKLDLFLQVSISRCICPNFFLFTHQWEITLGQIKVQSLGIWFSLLCWCSVIWIDHQRPLWNLSFYFYWFLKWCKWCTDIFQLKWQCRNTVAIYKVLFPTYTHPRYNNHWQQLQVFLSSPLVHSFTYSDT